MSSDERQELTRLEAMRSLQLLDTAPQRSFDRVTELCKQLFDCSISLITLLDEERQWFLSRQGIGPHETPREFSFCAEAVRSGKGLHVSDAIEDERFKKHPLVRRDLGVRSYMGQPISNREGILIGTLSVADPRPDWFNRNQLELLDSLARTVEDLIEAHRQKIEAANLSEQLGEQARIFRQAEGIAKIGSWELEIETRTLKRSEQADAILGVRKDQLQDLDEALGLYGPEDRPRVEAALTRVISLKNSESIEADIRTPQGQKKRVRVVGDYLEANSEHGPRIVGILQDVTEGHQAKLALKRAADYDALTGLFNRQAFDQLLTDKVARLDVEKNKFFVLMLDLDGFKDINDTFGHLIGDVVLETISSRIAENITPGVAASRWGGDEFALVTSKGASRSDISGIAEALIIAVAEPVEIAGRQVSVSATCGIAESGEGLSAREIVRRADLALYHGKRREPGRLHFYTAKLEHSNRLRQKAISRVRQALEEKRLFVAYQPIVDLSTHRRVGLEALMRLRTPKGQTLTASQVLPAFNDPILSREIGERILSLVGQEYSDIDNDLSDLQFLTLNATEADLLSRDFAGRLLSALRDYEIEPGRVVLEITETMLLVNDAVMVREVLSQLRQAGMQIALDDFGTGFSSLSHLRDFPIDKVKIDGSFVQKMCQDQQTELIVQALIGMAKNLGIEVIAEGVETPEQRDLLLKMGCDLGQGFLFSPAEPASRLHMLDLGGKAKMIDH